jgi:GH15 family glucan-1,4-alpha-glucosidase
MSDHVEWPLDNARDCFHIANALLLIKPELVRRHLRFYFLNAIPRSGAGKSYIGTGESRGHREARLLDLAAYPLWHLWRYWKATGDGEFAAQPQVRATAEQIAAEVLGWQQENTGLFTSTERSSDERCVFPIFVPGNAMLVGALERVAEVCRAVWDDESAAERFSGVAAQARKSLRQHAVVDDPEFGEVFAFEVDGHGKALLYDQADIPNLLSLPRFGFCPPDDSTYQNTVRFAYSRRNQGYRGTADGKYRQLCDGSKTMPFSPWPLGALGQLLSGAATPSDVARLFDYLRDALTPAFQLPEIVDKHTARPVQRYWFGWSTAALLMAFIEVVCGVKLGDEVTVEPLVPEGWQEFSSPRLTIRGREVLVRAEEGKPRVWVDSREESQIPVSL